MMIIVFRDINVKFMIHLNLLYGNRKFLHTTSSCLIKNYYDVLHIPKNASRKEIKLAFYKLSKQYHPDVNNNEDAEEKFKSIQEAYQILGDERKKVEYDMSINEGYYGGSRAGGGGGSTPGAGSWKRRGPAYTGRSTAYDFDEHFRAHYYRQRPSNVNYKNSFNESPFTNRKTYEKDLNDYWNTKEFSNQDSGREIRNNFISKSLYTLMILFLLSLYMHWSVVRESERGLKSYQLQQSKMNKNE